MLQQERVQVDINEVELQRIPVSEPFICLANRFNSDIDDLIMIKLLTERTGNAKMFIPSAIPLKPELQGYYYHSDFQNLSDHTALGLYLSNIPALLEKAKKMKISLGIFMDFSSQRFGAIRRNQQHNALMYALKKVKVPIVPVHFSSDGDKIIVRIGNPVSVEDQAAFGFSNRFRKFLQSRIFALGSALEIKPFYFAPKQQEEIESIAAPVDQELIEAEIQSLQLHNLITSRQNYDVFTANATQIPHVLTEIGRLREITFRSVGEGTGRRLDLDEFDLYYKQLIIWDREARCIVGGYRMGEGDKIFNRYGVDGFYISSLFDIKRGFYKIMRQSVELGRSYIVEAYQKKRLPLFLLWKGILFFLLKNPQFRYLYGPLSISKYYSDISKSIIVSFVKRNYYDRKLARYLKPKQPFTVQTDKVNIEVLLKNFGGSMRNLDNFIEDIEPAHFKIPILMKQYIKQNAKFISFNIDPNFSDVLDGFMILDLKDVPYSTIEALKREA